MGKRVTCRVVADHLGLSKETVTHILGGRTEAFRPETIARVEAAARDLGYRRNHAAGAVRTGRMGAVAMITRVDIGPLQAEVQRWVLHAAGERDWHVLTAELEADALMDPSRRPRLFREHVVDGILIHYAQQVPDSLVELLAGLSLPTIWLNTDHPWDAVIPDDQHALRPALEQLRKSGHRAATLLTPDPARFKHNSWLARQQGFLKGCKDLGITGQVWTIPADVEKDWALVDWIHERVRGAGRPSAVCLSRSQDVAAVVCACARLGLAIPQDVSLVALGSGGADRLHGLPISTVHAPVRQMVEAGMRMLEHRLASGGRQPTQRIPFPAPDMASIAAPAPM